MLKVIDDALAANVKLIQAASLSPEDTMMELGIL